jgi:thiol-disulfide isomerase/thioredoxin
MNSLRNTLSCVILCAIAAMTFTLPGCGDSGDVDETTNVSAPAAPPISVAPGDDKSETASTGGTPDFADEPSFSDPPSAAGQPTGIAVTTPPGPAPGLDPLLLPEPAPVDDTWRKQWGTDFAAAKKKAQAEGKDILVNFTGSNWCGYCIQLARDVFSEPEFAEYAQKHLVLVEADFPKDSSGRPVATVPEHEELSEQFEVSAFPTILLFDKLGRPFAQTGYQPGGPQNYNAHLDDLLLARVDRDAALTAADGLKGVERAKKLDEALASLPSAFVFPSYVSIVEEIIKLDTENAVELRSQYQDSLANHKFMTRVKAIEKRIPDTDDPDAILADIEKVAAEFGKDPQRGAVATIFRINVLNHFDRIDESLTFAAGALQNESLDSDYRAQIYISLLRILNQADRQEDALSIIDQAIESFQKNDALKMEFFIARADFLQKLNRTEEARAAVAEARKAGGPAAAFRIDQFEQSVLGSISAKPEPSIDLPEPKTSEAAKPAEADLPEPAAAKTASETPAKSDSETPKTSGSE